MLGFAARWLSRLESAIIAGGILGIAGLTIGNVVARIFGGALFFAEELSQFLIVLVTFVGTAHAAARGRHIRMTAIYDALPDGARKALMMWIQGTTALLLFGLAFLSARYAFGTMKELGSVSPTLRAPLWTVYVVAPFGLTIAGVQYLLGLAKNATSEGIWRSFTERDEYETEDGDEDALLEKANAV